MDSQTLFRVKNKYEFVSYFILSSFLMIITYYMWVEDGRQLAAIAVAFFAAVWILLGLLKYAAERSEYENIGQ